MGATPRLLIERDTGKWGHHTLKGNPRSPQLRRERGTSPFPKASYIYVRTRAVDAVLICQYRVDIE